MKQLALISLLLLGTIGSLMAQKDKRAETILDAMSARYKALTSYQAAFSYSADRETYKGDIAVKGKMFRLKTAGQEVFTDGKVMSTYVKESNEVNIQDYDASASGDFNPTKIYSMYKKGFNYTYVREQKTAGRVLDVIELKPEKKNTQIANVQISVDRADKSVRSWLITDKNGKRTSYTISKFTPNPNLADSYFIFDKSKYPGVEVVDLR
ncbi:LolA family protein [Fibrella forsythiae]|uniref:Outer membrane lipoprotein carrier protein LolA n=1 Tax=Fibrella forsythiae TaxID=2817061 RepID=A0ABS3JR20_9BACT|nr:outer membrane lipoprotein carrier protein LolA [Fibrella forsythiae]MBO0952459.1 outer membrane lipoprotein carrier protein LolA [Fibrella forsythiae]